MHGELGQDGVSLLFVVCRVSCFPFSVVAEAELQGRGSVCGMHFLIPSPSLLGLSFSACPLVGGALCPSLPHMQYKSNLVAQLGADRVKDVLDVTCDTFYASQAWPMRDFEDRNTTLLNDMKQAYEGQDLICEMETFHLYDLARCCRTRKMFVAAAAIVVDNQEGSHPFPLLNRTDSCSCVGCIMSGLKGCRSLFFAPSWGA